LIRHFADRARCLILFSKIIKARAVPILSPTSTQPESSAAAGRLRTRYLSPAPAEPPWEQSEATAYTSGPQCDLVSVTGLTGNWGAAATVGAAASHVLAWPYTVAVLALRAAYRLLAERARRKTLVDLVSHAPTGTIVVMEKGPGGPAMCIRVGGEIQLPSRPEVWRER
jgi:hypothetical protein